MPGSNDNLKILIKGIRFSYPHAGKILCNRIAMAQTSTRIHPVLSLLPLFAINPFSVVKSYIVSDGNMIFMTRAQLFKASLA